jgi:hypothetical protein
MDMACKFGLMVPSTEVIGKITELTVKDASGTLMAIGLKVNSKTTSRTARELTHVKTEQFIKECGLMMFSMDRAKHSGQTVLISLEITLKVRSMVLVHTNGQKAINIKVSGKIT